MVYITSKNCGVLFFRFLSVNYISISHLISPETMCKLFLGLWVGFFFQILCNWESVSSAGWRSLLQKFFCISFKYGQKVYSFFFFNMAVLPDSAIWKHIHSAVCHMHTDTFLQQQCFLHIDWRDVILEAQYRLIIQYSIHRYSLISYESDTNSFRSPTARTYLHIYIHSCLVRVQIKRTV